ncbi:lanthionine synthetase C family protein [Streptomyces sp. NPDC003077]|uniref:lanthionine synthetase C family protein n=1 Tax=Streptomyces sp. NPDC003077 TaxID=3154443 RepID=UPI0033B20603
MHIERAHRDAGDWHTVHRHLAAIGPLIDGDDASLYLGAPAMAYVLHLAAADTNRYANALRTLYGLVAAHTRRRLAAAHARIDQGGYTTFAEYDLFRGLTGIGALLLHRRPGSIEMKGILEYLVRLTEPVSGPSGRPVLGWWTDHAPSTHTAATPGGHANVGMAHGIAGPLTLLALAKRRGVTVAGHEEAMYRICHWLDRIRYFDYRWPRWISAEGPAPAIPTAPSWCYGTPGLARAQQLAGIALNDEKRKRMAERALLHCLSDPQQLDEITERGLCHGFGGLLRTVQRVAQDAQTPHLFTDQLPPLRQRCLTAPPPQESGFLQGTAGAALALQCCAPGAGPAGDWDACLLLA